MDKFNISYDLDPSTIVYTLIAIAYDGKFAGYITIADSIKEDAQITIDKLKALGVEIVDEDDVAVDMQAFAKEKSRKMLQKGKQHESMPPANIQH
jgi:hypothetical protein